MIQGDRVNDVPDNRIDLGGCWYGFHYPTSVDDWEEGLYEFTRRVSDLF